MRKENRPKLPPMRFPQDPVIYHQLPLIAQIIRDETWLEAERRGHSVPPDDPVVRANVCAVILRIGAEMRAEALRRTKSEAPRRSAA